MFSFDITLFIVLALGIFLGLLVGNKNFRRKFFISFRKFLAGMRTEQNHRTQRRQSNRNAENFRPEVEHRYIQDHHLVTCPRCNGTGRIPKATPKLLSKKLWGGQTEKCPGCGGTGKVYD